MSILKADHKQFGLSDEGQVLYQEKVGSPLPGEPVAILVRGESVLAPKISLLKEEEGLEEKLSAWLTEHIKTVLEPLVALENDASESEAVKGIAARIYDAMGILPREALEDLIAQLDTDTRRDLRAKNIRLGPILVFMPALNKPAAVRLRALLWGLYNEKDLPMPVPKDGVVSFALDENSADKAFYQAVGYPVYGGRAIRIDMLDRVICAVYDGAEKGVFKAQHTMAEWLGSSIDGLYDVLEAMGHKKLEDKAEDGKAEEVEAKEPLPEGQKPELATFRLKKGKAFQSSGKSSGGGAGKKPFKKKDDAKKPYKGKRNKTTNKAPRVMSAEAKVVEDSPFAVLEQLKK